MSHTLRTILTASLVSAALVLGTPEARAASAPASPVAPAGVVPIGNFAGPIITDAQNGPHILNHGHEFGWGWALSTDRMMGGASSAQMALVQPGVHSAKHALEVSGTLESGFVQPWAGVFWFAGRAAMQPGDIAGKTKLVFWAKGAPGRYVVMLLTGSGFIPKSVPFTLTAQWKEYRIPLTKSFPNADWKQVMYLGFSASQPGKFRFDVDAVSLR